MNQKLTFGRPTLRPTTVDPTIIPDKINLVRCKLTNMMIVDENCIKSVHKSVSYDKILVLKYKSTSCVVTLKWKGQINKKPCLGIELDKDSEYGTNGTFNNHKLFECIGRKGVLVMLDDSITCCEGEVLGASAGGSGHNTIITHAYKNIVDKCICCMEGKDKFWTFDFIKIGKKIMVKDAFYGTIKWIGFVNGVECIGVEIDECIDGTNGTFNQIKLFDCQLTSGALYKIEDIVKTFVCPQIMLSVLNPTCLQSIRRYSQMSKYIVPRSHNKSTALNVKWMGTINGELCVGGVLTSYYRNGTNGCFMDEKLFECDYNKGVMVPVKELSDKCLSDAVHDDAACKDDVGPIEEDSICCMKTASRNDNIPIGQLVVIEICGKKRLVRLLWTGKINGTDSVGIVMDSMEDLGTNGTFCGIKLFQCTQGFGVLYRLRHIKYVPKIEFSKEVYLLKDYDLKSVEQVKSDPNIDKIFHIKDTPSIRGYFRFSMQLLDEKLMVLEINRDDSEANKEAFKDVIYDNDIIPGKSALVVKYNSAEMVAEKLSYIPSRSSVRQVGGNQSSPIHNKEIKIVPKMELKRILPLRNQRSTTIKADHNIESPPLDKESGSLMTTIKFLESTVMNPRSFKTAEIKVDKKWIIGNKIKFRLPISGHKYCGLLKWTGMVNTIPSAVVHLDNISSTDILFGYLCPKDVIDQINLSEFENMVIVPLASLRGTKKRAYIKRVFEYLKDKEFGIDFLMEIISNEDTRELKGIIKEWTSPIILERYPQVLSKLMSQDNYELISIILGNIVASDKDSIDLLNIAKHFLMRGDYQTCILASAKCINRNIILGNGETFLTDIIKNVGNEEWINKIIGSKMFDVNPANTAGETPLVIACGRLMITTIRLLLSSGASKSYNNNMALCTIMDLRSTINDMEKVTLIFEIINLMISGIRLETNICSICIDQPINTSLNCGHTMCDGCAAQMIDCPQCQSRITERNRIFLD